MSSRISWRAKAIERQFAIKEPTYFGGKVGEFNGRISSVVLIRSSRGPRQTHPIEQVGGIFMGK